MLERICHPQGAHSQWETACGALVTGWCGEGRASRMDGAPGPVAWSASESDLSG